MAIDLVAIQAIKNVHIIKGDFNEEIIKKKIEDFFKTKVDLVLSDMAVNTSGNKNLDSMVTSELTSNAIEFAKKILKNNGQFVSKVFMGLGFNEVVALSKKYFKETNVFKPPSSRKNSKETFIISKNLR